MFFLMGLRQGLTLVGHIESGATAFDQMAEVPGLAVSLIALASVVFIDRAVADRQRMTEALERSRLDLQLVMDTIPQRVFWKDRQFRYLGCNRPFAADAGLASPEEIVGKDDFELSWRESAAGYRADDIDVVERGVVKVDYEEPQDRPDGTRLWLRTTKLPLLDAEGRIIGVFGSYADISERHLIEERLRRSQKLESIGRMAGGIAHDFNNLLVVLIVTADLLQRAIDADDPRRQHVDRILEAASRAESLTAQLLAFGRQQVLRPAAVDVSEAIGRQSSMIETLVGERIEVARNLSAEAPLVRVDPGQFQQVLLNLAANARDAMPAGGRLTLSVGRLDLDDDEARALDLRPGRFAEIAVADDGTGMDRATVERAVEPFFTTKGPGQGTGLGLSSVDGIVRQSGGCLTIESRPGEGTTVRILLPAIEAPAAAARPAADPASPASPGHILIVEDEPLVRQLVVETLEQAGHRVESAASGREALDRARSTDGPFDLLLTDVAMPDLEGPDLARRLRTENPGLRVLFMSGYPGESLDPTAGLGSGVDFVQKPFTPARLLERIERLLGDALLAQDARDETGKA